MTREKRNYNMGNMNRKKKKKTNRLHYSISKALLDFDIEEEQFNLMLRGNFFYLTTHQDVIQLHNEFDEIMMLLEKTLNKTYKKKEKEKKRV